MAISIEQLNIGRTALAIFYSNWSGKNSMTLIELFDKMGSQSIATIGAYIDVLKSNAMINDSKVASVMKAIALNTPSTSLPSLKLIQSVMSSSVGGFDFLGFFKDVAVDVGGKFQTVGNVAMGAVSSGPWLKLGMVVAGIIGIGYLVNSPIAKGIFSFVKRK